MRRRVRCLATLLAAWTGLAGGLTAAQAQWPGGFTRPEPPPLWRVDGEGWGRPVAGDAAVYFLSKRHELLALAPETGRVLWKQATGEAGDITGGAAVVLSGEVVAAGDGSIVAFDRQTGAMRWRYRAADGYDVGRYLGAAAQGLIFCGSTTGRLHAVDDRSGRARWTLLVNNDDRNAVYAPVTDEDLVVASYTTMAAPLQGGVVAADAATGRERWRTAFPRPSAPLVETGASGGPLFVDSWVVASSGDGSIHAFDRRTGLLQWTIPRLPDGLPGTGASPERDFRPLARAGRLLVAGSLTGRVSAYDLVTREERWRFFPALHASVAMNIVSDGRYVYAPYFAGTFIVLDAETGEERWRVGDWKRGLSWPVAVVGERVFAAGAGVGFLAFMREVDFEQEGER